jgi:asparagine synthase (glutamine-hydrolysing)
VLVDPPLPEVLEGIRVRLETAVVKRLMSDVPVGVFLSGGLDSSLVAAMMRPHTVDLFSFTAGIKGAPDLAMAKSMAEYLGTEHYELLYTENDVEQALPEVIRYLESFDAPLVRSAIPMYFLSTLASRYVKVALTGEGADELFAGYDYLKRFEREEDLNRELVDILVRLQDTNLQRADRVTMRHGLEGRVPFLDMDLVRFVVRLPAGLKKPQADRPEKWLLREACKGLLPFSILNRKKLKFSEGAGSAEVMAQRVRDKISPDEFERERQIGPGFILRSPEELYYYRIWRDVMGADISPELVGRTCDRAAAA